jgi:hypothetical protein
MKQTTPLVTSGVEQDNSRAGFSAFVDAALSPSGMLWRRWFDRVGDAATIRVVNATADLVIGERELYAKQPSTSDVFEDPDQGMAARHSKTCAAWAITLDGKRMPCDCKSSSGSEVVDWEAEARSIINKFTSVQPDTWGASIVKDFVALCRKAHAKGRGDAADKLGELFTKARGADYEKGVRDAADCALDQIGEGKVEDSTPQASLAWQMACIYVARKIRLLLPDEKTEGEMKKEL